MRTIPVALKQKLLNRVKADSTNSAPNLRIIATQTSINTLLSEPIHEDISPDYGDVTIRQLPGEKDISMAYAICLDDGNATIYQRRLPANMDFKWEYLWRYGPAEDVAIEYDGVWKLDAQAEWYHLETERYPYIFTVESGNLYVQMWDDRSTRLLLAENVSQISACKGWKNSIDVNLDQGLIIGYLRDGQVFYRALCTQPDGTRVWETERAVTQLGSSNLTLSVIRTNDFRIGFLTEQSGGSIRLALTHRTWAGMSVRPETVHVHTRTHFQFRGPNVWQTFAPRETGRVTIRLPYFNIDSVPESPEISVTRVERLNRTDAFTTYGCKVFFDKPIRGETDAAFLAKATLTAMIGTTSTAVAIRATELLQAEQAIAFYFAEDLRRVYDLTLNTATTRAVWYYRLPQQSWFLPAYQITIPGETNDIYAKDSDNYVSVRAVSGYEYLVAVFHSGFHTEGAAFSVRTEFELSPVQSQPI